MNIYYLAGIICVIFLGIKGVEYKYNKDEDKSFKSSIIDTIYVFISIILGDFIITQVNPILKDSGPNVFIDNPSF
jgi:cytochrome bd-type quinol oxidase subunit 2